MNKKNQRYGVSTDIFRDLSTIEDEEFCKNSLWLLAVMYFRKTLYLNVWQGSQYISGEYMSPATAQKAKFSFKDFLSKCDQIRR